MLAGEMKLPKMDGAEIAPGIYLVGEPSPLPGTDKLRCLARIGDALGIVELKLKFPNVD